MTAAVSMMILGFPLTVRRCCQEANEEAEAEGGV